jgi:hypothetical protein
MAAYFGVVHDPSVFKSPTRAYATLRAWDDRKITDVFEAQPRGKYKLGFYDQPLAFLMCGTTDELKSAILESPLDLVFKSYSRHLEFWNDLMCVNYVRIDAFTGSNRIHRQTISLVCIAQLFQWWRILLSPRELEKYDEWEIDALNLSMNDNLAPDLITRQGYTLAAGRDLGWFPLHLQPQKKFYGHYLRETTLSNGEGRDAWFREKQDKTKGFERIESRWNIRGYVNGKKPANYPT